MKKITFIIIFLCLTTFSCHRREVFYYGAPSMLPGISVHMKTAGYWISKIKEPDKILLNENEIKELNAKIVSQSELIYDISNFCVIR
ncbi:hypothetical protein HZA55_03260 [Candidatus Poribacteria bacterium]|nr:hypothetical protein [Candidatus Poribacteria bacterium]